MKIILATDHAGFELKEHVKAELTKIGYELIDTTEFLEPGDDYPIKISTGIKTLLETLETDAHAKAIIFGGSGEGEAMVANRFKKIRATVYYGGNPEILKLSFEHNFANVLSLGARFLNTEQAFDAAKTWLGYAKEITKIDERHEHRIAQIDQLD